MTINNRILAGSLAALFVLTATTAPLQSKGGCPALLWDARFTAVAQLNDGTLTGELGRGVKGRKVTGLSTAVYPPYGEALLIVTARRSSTAAVAFVMPFATLTPVVRFDLPLSLPSETDYSRVEIANINGDPLPDVVVASAGAQTASVFLGYVDSEELKYPSSGLVLNPPSGVTTSRFGEAVACGNLQPIPPTDEIAISDIVTGKVFLFEFDAATGTFATTTLASTVSGDGFGKSLAIADVGGTPDFDLIVGANNRPNGSTARAGAVIVYFGPDVSASSPITLTAANLSRNDSLGQGVSGGDVHGGILNLPDVIALKLGRWARPGFHRAGQRWPERALAGVADRFHTDCGSWVRRGMVHDWVAGLGHQ